MSLPPFLNRLVFIRSCKGLFIAVLTFYLLAPYMDRIPFLNGGPIQAFFYTFILITGVNAVRRTKRQIILALSLAVPGLMFAWINVGFRSYYLSVLEFALLISFILFTAGS